MEVTSLLGLFFESIAFGIFVAFGSFVIWLLWHERRRDFFMLVVMFFLLVVSAVHVAFSLTGLRVDPSRVNNDFANSTGVIGVYLFVTQTILSQSFLVYRTWRLWHFKSLVVKLSSVPVMLTAVTGYISPFTMASVASRIKFLTKVPWVGIFLGIAFLTFLGLAVTISIKILPRLVFANQSAGRRAVGGREVSFILDSGALLSILFIISFFVHMLNPSGDPLRVDVFSVVTQILGIVISAMIMRIRVVLKTDASELANTAKQQPMEQTPSSTEGGYMSKFTQGITNRVKPPPLKSSKNEGNQKLGHQRSTSRITTTTTTTQPELSDY